MHINKSKIQNNIISFLLKKNNLQVNISDISDILGISYFAVKNEIIYYENFPMPVIDRNLPLEKKWLLYDILAWVLNEK